VKSKTPRTDQRLLMLKKGYSKCLPKWEDFAKTLETELEALSDKNSELLTKIDNLINKIQR